MSSSDTPPERASGRIERGRVVGGKYQLTRLLGRGLMGRVWVARHITLDEEVALKLPRYSRNGEFENRATAEARFRFAAQVAARLSRRTRHVVRVTDHGKDELAYLVMELLAVRPRRRDPRARSHAAGRSLGFRESDRPGSRLWEEGST